MSLSGLVSESVERFSQLGKEVTSILEDDEASLIEKKDELKEKIAELPVSKREWRIFSKLLDEQKHVKAAKKVKNDFGWSEEVLEEAAIIYSNMTYYQSEIEISEAKGEIYGSAKSMQSLEEQLNQEKIDKEEIAERYTSAHNNLKKALSRINDSEKELDRSRTAAETFEISGKLIEKLNQKELEVDKLKTEFKSIDKHLAEKKEQIT